jgi:GTP-binding protein
LNNPDPRNRKAGSDGAAGRGQQESAKAGVSYIRSISKELDINEDFYKENDLHIHIPEGATPKDGPSAGVTMCTAIIINPDQYPGSKRRRHDRRDHPERKGSAGWRHQGKGSSAHRAGIKKVLLPADNEKDIEEIPANVRKKMEFVLIRSVKEALDHAWLSRVPKVNEGEASGKKQDDSKESRTGCSSSKEKSISGGQQEGNAFAGRSNVGKSSLLNLLVNRKNLARVSGSPGKTRTINFYEINEEFRIVDLPGYGYAKVSKSVTENWGDMIEGYLASRQGLIKVVQLVDIRHAPSAQDVQMYQWLRHYGYDGIVVATKSDKISRNEMAKNISEIRKTLGLTPEDKVIPVSSLKRTGYDMLLEELDRLLEEE